MLSARSVVLVFAVGAALAGCKAHHTKRGFRIGTGCEKMDESCSGASSANLCRDGALATVSCKGPKGCVDSPTEDVACDQSVAVENDPCVGDGYACLADQGALLECRNGVFEKKSTCSHNSCTVTVAGVGGATLTTTSCR